MDIASTFRTLAFRLRKLLRRHGVRGEEAHDLIQETFLRMAVYCHQGGDVREPEAFAVRTALNLAMNAHRDDRRHLYAQETVETLPLVDTGPGPDEVLAAEQCLERMNRALESLSSRTREVFRLHRLNGLSHTQIAEHFDISVNAVQKHMARAMTVLSEQVLKP